MTETVTPNDMPGAPATSPSEAEKPGAVTEAKTGKTAATDKAPTNGALTADERAELERLRNTHKDEQKHRREATDNHRDAEAYRQLAPILRDKLGIDAKGKDFDPQAAITELNSKFESERQARIRAEVSRTEDVDPEHLTGSTEEEMRASAQRLKVWVEAQVAKRDKTVAPAAAPASAVTANGKVDGAKQITSPDQFKGMTRKQIIEAHKGGQLDDMAGRKP